MSFAIDSSMVLELLYGGNIPSQLILTPVISYTVDVPRGLLSKVPLANEKTRAVVNELL